MADESGAERPVPPTERRLERARQLGDVAMSRDLVTAGMLALACGLLLAMGKAWLGGLTAYIRSALASATSSQALEEPLSRALVAAAGVLAWPLPLIFAGGLAVGFVQSRGWALPDSGPTASRSGGQGLSWRDRLADLAADVLKLAVLSSVAVVALAPLLSLFAALPTATARQATGALLALGQRLAIRLVFAVAVLGLVDYLWRRARHRHRLRMTHEEAKREQRESEGDPEQKMERQRLHRELHAQPAPSDARSARWLLLDPGRAAAAVGWSEQADEPPVLIVRGEGPRARAVEAEACAAGVPTCLAPALVRALGAVAEGSVIPQALYAALARAGAAARPGCRPPPALGPADGKTLARRPGEGA